MMQFGLVTEFVSDRFKHRKNSLMQFSNVSWMKNKKNL